MIRSAMTVSAGTIRCGATGGLSNAASEVLSSPAPSGSTLQEDTERRRREAAATVAGAKSEASSPSSSSRFALMSKARRTASTTTVGISGWAEGGKDGEEEPGARNASTKCLVDLDEGGDDGGDQDGNIAGCIGGLRQPLLSTLEDSAIGVDVDFEGGRELIGLPRNPDELDNSSTPALSYGARLGVRSGRMARRRSSGFAEDDATEGEAISHGGDFSASVECRFPPASVETNLSSRMARRRSSLLGADESCEELPALLERQEGSSCSERGGDPSSRRSSGGSSRKQVSSSHPRGFHPGTFAEPKKSCLAVLTLEESLASCSGDAAANASNGARDDGTVDMSEEEATAEEGEVRGAGMEAGVGGNETAPSSSMKGKRRVGVRSMPDLTHISITCSNATTSSSSGGMRRNVSFAKVLIREYERTLGDNPTCSAGGPPLSIGWNIERESQLNLEEYEQARRRGEGEVVGGSRPRRSSTTDLVVQPAERKALLKKWGYTAEELKLAMRDVNRTKRSRRHSVRRDATPNKVEELVERGGRKLKRIVTRRSKKKEEKKMWEQARKREEQLMGKAKRLSQLSRSSSASSMSSASGEVLEWGPAHATIASETNALAAVVAGMYLSGDENGDDNCEWGYFKDGDR